MTLTICVAEPNGAAGEDSRNTCTTGRRVDSLGAREEDCLSTRSVRLQLFGAMGVMTYVLRIVCWAAED